MLSHDVCRVTIDYESSSISLFNIASDNHSSDASVNTSGEDDDKFNLHVLSAEEIGIQLAPVLKHQVLKSLYFPSQYCERNSPLVTLLINAERGGVSELVSELSVQHICPRGHTRLL